MKSIRFQLDDSTHKKLRDLCSHHGELSHLIRRGVELIIKQKEQELYNAKEPRRSFDKS